MTRGETWTLLLFSGIETGASLADALVLANEIGGRYKDRVVSYVVLAGAKPLVPIQGVGAILLDALHLAHERYGIAGSTFYLLRPDTYVAARGPIAQHQALLDYLSTLFA